MLASAFTFTLLGVEARPVRVEVDVHGGLGSFSIVGLPDTAIRESRERVRAALGNSGFEFPLQRITANLAPADLRKGGPGLDLAIAAALLGASKQLPASKLDDLALVGELALNGSIRSVPGVLAMAEAARGCGARALAVPTANGAEAALAGGPRVVPISHLRQLELIGTEDEPPAPAPLPFSRNGGSADLPDLAELRGQPALRRALEIAAAGGHNLLLVGPPGAGKSMAARRIPSILPPLSDPEAIEVLRIASACGGIEARPDPRLRPFRAPHHTISTAGLVGGGTPPRPGEVTLAHRGVLFLDELGELARDALEALRQPLEDGRVTIVRANHAVALPCRFMLVAATNPCPCGKGPESPDCECSPGAVHRYQARVSGALADRIDAIVVVERPDAEEIAGGPGEGSAAVRERVRAARERQERRLGAGRCNADASGAEVRARGLGSTARDLLAAGYERLGLSGRGYDRALRLARTIADLDGRDEIGPDHVGEALSLRRRGPTRVAA